MAGNIFFELCGTYMFSPSHNTICTSDGIFFHLKFRESKLLQLLLEGTHDKNKLMDAIWCGGEVSENSYHKLVSKLRSVLFEAGMGDTIIKTLPRRGCCFMGTVRCFSKSEDTHWSNILNQDFSPSFSEKKLANFNQAFMSTEDEVFISKLAKKNLIKPHLKADQAIKPECELVLFGKLNVAKLYGSISFSIRDLLYTSIFTIALFVPFWLQSTSLFFINFSRIYDGERTLIITNYITEEHLSGLKGKVIYAAHQSSYEVYLLCKTKSIKERVCTSLILE